MKWLFLKPDGCEVAEALIQRSLDEPLTAAERKRLDAHVAGCDSCRKAWDDYRRLSRAASQWLTEASTDPGDEFTQRVMADLGLAVDTSGAMPVALDRHGSNSVNDAVRPSSSKEQRRSFPSLLWWGVAGVGLVAVLAISSLFLPPLTHLGSVADAYTPSIPTLPSTPAQWWSTMRPQASEVVDMVQSWTWPVYAFVGALVANLALAAAARNRGRAT